MSQTQLTSEERFRLRALYFQLLKLRLTPSEINDAKQRQEERIKKIIAENPGEKIYRWGYDTGFYGTVNQMATYCANIMVRGVDKSKIFPIYDWDGNLLWPT